MNRKEMQQWLEQFPEDTEIVYDRYFSTDEIFWSGVETQEKMLDYIKRIIDGGNL